MKARISQNTLASILTGVAVVLFLTFSYVFFQSANEASQAAADNVRSRSPQVGRYARLFEERSALASRVRACELEAEGDIPDYRRRCSDEQRSNLDAYRARIKEIDAELSRLRDAPTSTTPTLSP